MAQSVGRRGGGGWVILLLLVGAGAAFAAYRASGGRVPTMAAWRPMVQPIVSALAPLVPGVPPASSGESPDAGADAASDAAPPPVHRQRGPLSAAQLGAPLVHGTFVPACGAPDSMKITVHVSVKEGRAVDVEAKSNPPNPVVEGCVERAIRDLRWDISPKLGRATVHY